MVVFIVNKYYANKEMVYPFTVINQLEYEKEDIEHRNYLNELFKSLLLEIDGRITGATLLSEMAIGDVLDSACVEDEDLFIYDVIQQEKDADKLIVDEDVLLIAKKRLAALKVFHTAINRTYEDFLESSGGAGG